MVGRLRVRYGVEADQRGQRVGACGRVRDVSAERAHVANLRGADGMARVGQRGRGLVDQRRLHDLAEVGPCADDDAVPLAANRMELRDEGHVDKPVAQVKFFAHQQDEVGPAGQHARPHARFV